MDKNIKNAFYKLKTEDGEKWIHFNRLFVSKIKDVSGKDINQFGKHLQSLDNMLNWEEQFDAITDLVMAGMLAHDENEGNDITYDIEKVGEWLYYAMEEDDKVLANIFEALTSSTRRLGKKRTGRFTPPKK